MVLWILDLTCLLVGFGFLLPVGQTRQTVVAFVSVSESSESFKCSVRVPSSQFGSFRATKWTDMCTALKGTRGSRPSFNTRCKRIQKSCYRYVSGGFFYTAATQSLIPIKALIPFERFNETWLALLSWLPSKNASKRFSALEKFIFRSGKLLEDDT